MVILTYLYKLWVRPLLDQIKHCDENQPSHYFWEWAVCLGCGSVDLRGPPPPKKNVSTTFGEAQPFIVNTYIEVLVNMAHSVSGWNRYCHKDPQKDTWTFRGLPNWSKQTSCYLETAPAGHEEYLQTCRECNKPLWKLLLPSWSRKLDTIQVDFTYEMMTLSQLCPQPTATQSSTYRSST